MYTMVMLLTLSSGAAAPAFTHHGCGGCGGYVVSNGCGGYACGGGWGHGCRGGSGFCGHLFNRGGCGGWGRGCAGWSNGCSGVVVSNGCSGYACGGGCGGQRHGFCGSGFCGRLFNRGGCAGWACNGGSGWACNGGCSGVIYSNGCAGAPVQVVPATPAPEAPAEAKPTDAPETAKVIVNVPANAKLYIEGVAMSTTGSVRHFESPALVAGKAYTYTLKAEVDRNGTPVSVSRTVEVRAGQTVTATLDLPVTVAAK